MSSRNSINIEKSEFVKRFIEICGTSEAGEISKKLNISYQAARNYLEGRLPDSYVLINIADKTPYSIHWLLTGNGGKFVDKIENIEEKMFLGKMREAAKQGCSAALLEMLDGSSAKTVILENTKLRSEKSRKDKNVSPVSKS